MAYRPIPFEKMQAFCRQAFAGYGFSADESAAITEVLLDADLSGIESHGVQRLIRYHKEITSGMVNPAAKPEIIFETPLSAVLDGHDCMGQTLGIQAMELAVRKAKQFGAGFVTVRASNHFGIAGYYAKLAMRQGRDSEKADGQTRIYIHGEKELLSRERVMRDGIPVNEKTYEELQMIGSCTGASDLLPAWE